MTCRHTNITIGDEPLGSYAPRTIEHTPDLLYFHLLFSLRAACVATIHKDLIPSPDRSHLALMRECGLATHVESALMRQRAKPHPAHAGKAHATRQLQWSLRGHQRRQCNTRISLSYLHLSYVGCDGTEIPEAIDFPCQHLFQDTPYATAT